MPDVRWNAALWAGRYDWSTKGRRCSAHCDIPAPCSKPGVPITTPINLISRLGWMSPAIYAADQRSAALHSTDGSAARTAVTTAQQGNAGHQTPIVTG
jgi:hypothetical protein